MLYVMLAATLGAFAAAEFLLPAGPFRMIAEGVGALIAFVEMKLWVSASGVRLDDELACCTARVTIRVAHVGAARPSPWGEPTPVAVDNRAPLAHEELVHAAARLPETAGGPPRRVMPRMS